MISRESAARVSKGRLTPRDSLLAPLAVRGDVAVTAGLRAFLRAE